MNSLWLAILNASVVGFVGLAFYFAKNIIARFTSMEDKVTNLVVHTENIDKSIQAQLSFLRESQNDTKIDVRDVMNAILTEKGSSRDYLKSSFHKDASAVEKKTYRRKQKSIDRMVVDKVREDKDGSK